MSGEYIPELVRQMTTERDDLAARIGLLDGALEALRRVYPGIAAPAGAPVPGNGHAPVTVEQAPPAAAEKPDAARREVTRAPKAAAPRRHGPALTVTAKTPAPPPPTQDGKPGLSGGDQAVVTLVAANDGLMPGEVAERLGVTYQTAYAKLQRLVGLKFITRGADKLYRGKG